MNVKERIMLGFPDVEDLLNSTFTPTVLQLCDEGGRSCKTLDGFIDNARTCGGSIWLNDDRSR